MKILHVVAHADRVGGAEAATLGLAAAQAARGDRVSIAHYHPGGSAPDGTSLVHVTDDPSLRRAIASLRPDVVHVHGLPPAGEGALAGMPIVLSLHDYSFACATGERWFRNGNACGRAHGAGCIDGILRRGCAHRVDVRGPLQRYSDLKRRLPALRQMPATVVHSRSVREIAITNGFAPERVHVIPCFVSRAARPTPLGSQRSCAFAGRIVGGKGLDVALRAFAIAGEAVEELHVLGDGWGRPAAERLAAKLGLGSRVRFHGWQGPEEVARIVRGARALLLPSRWPEPFGIAGLEAFAVGRPVLASRVGGIPEWLEDGVGGLLVPPGDAQALAAAMRRVAGDDALAAQLGRRAWIEAGRYSASAHLAALDAVYADVSDPRRAAA